MSKSMTLRLLALIACVALATAGDAALVRERLSESLIRRAGPAPEPPAADGTWSDIDYTHQARAGWKTREHLVRTRDLAAHGAHAQALAALDHWLAKDYRNPNWWHDEIGTPLLVGETLIMLGSIAADRVGKADLILARGDIRKKKAWFKTGQNQVWYATVMLYRALLKNNLPEIAEAMRWASEPMAVTEAEGIQPDSSFHQHGAQLYNGGYGAAFLNSCGLLIRAVDGTPWAVPADCRTTVVNLALEGTRWMSWGPQVDWGAMGRELARRPDPAAPARIVHAVTDLSVIPSPRQAELKTLAAQLQGDGDPTLPHGGRYFPRSDFLAHRRPGWTAMIKLGSARVLASETGNEENLLAEGLAHGLCLIRRQGDEFTGMPPLWDWSLLPGSTHPARQPRDIPWDKGTGAPRQTSKGVRTGGLADAAGSVAVHDLAVNGLTAIKRWFAADVGVASVTTVTAAGGKEAVRTTLIAQRLDGPVRVLSGGTWHDGASGQIMACQALWHDGVLWWLPDAPKVALRLETRGASWSKITTAYDKDTVEAMALVEAWVVTPPGTTLRWMALPGQPSPTGPAAPEALPAVSDGPGWSACWWPRQRLAQVIFTEAASAEGPWGLLVSDQPAAVQLDRGNRRLLAAETGRTGGSLGLRVDTSPITAPWPTGSAAGSMLELPLP